MTKWQIGRHNTKIFYLAEFFRSLIFTIPVWIAFLQERITPMEISLYVSAVFFTQLVLELPTGALADLIGRRKTIALAYLVDGVQYILFAFANSFPQVMLLAIISGLAEALRSGSLEALVYDSLKEDKRENDFKDLMAKQGMFFQTGLIISTIIGGILGAKWLPLPFVVTGIFAFVAAIVAYFFVEPKIDSEVFSLRNYLRQIKWGAIEAFKTTKHSNMSLYYIAVGSISWMCATYFNDYILVDLGFAVEQRGMLSAILRVINILLIYKVLNNEKILNFQRTILFFPILMIISLLPGYYLQNYWGLPFVGGAMLSSTARWILLGKYTNAVFDSKYRATAISTLSMAIGLIYVVGVALSGPIMQNWGDSRLMYSLLGLLSILVLPYLAYRILRVDYAK